ncbi:hypothetical protein C5B42_02755 [Candidatus Cerribacteria bacterium 'Amazon FNV 2010 28 9']|uniref:DUF4012 domain-containing protein n=1 Tax=Candidatus Cerribacteria bacterium 'Amazon FNV 2010 28 9' TaxID=2081795 RepID=A0A317JNW2_9BACT|nr:MAG: hypothetical protein C5B42_02755 [Candidatus Cerribacteria bacterium 'Amazon FNV 2010 28 9']
MSRRFVTEQIRETPRVVVCGPVRPLQKALVQLLSAAHLYGGVIHVQNAQRWEPPLLREGEYLLILWIGEPGIWTGRERAQTQVLAQTLAKHSPHLIYISFDPLSRVETEIERQWKLDQEQGRQVLISLFSPVHMLSYTHVFEPSLPPLSLVDTQIRTLISQKKRLCMDSQSQINPIWHEDVAADIVSRVLSGVKDDMCLEGNTPIGGEALVRSLEPTTSSRMDPIQVIVPHVCTGISIVSRPFISFVEVMRGSYQSLLPVDLQKPKVVKKRSLSIKKIGMMAGIVCSCLVCGLVLLWVSSGFALRSLATQIQHIHDKQLSAEDLNTLSQALGVVTFLKRTQGNIEDTIGEQSDGVVGSLSILSSQVQAVQDLRSAQEKLALSYEQVMGKGKGSSLQSIVEAEALLDRSYQSMSLVQARLSQDPNAISVVLGGSVLQDELTEEVSSERKLITMLRSILTVLPDMLGKNDVHTYAFVLQDSSVLRPSGGKIVSVALVSFNQGTLTGVHIYPVSSLDTLLPGTVKAPAEAASALKTTNWQLDDANWDLQFKNNAAQISWFIGKELNTTVNGVFVVNSRDLNILLSSVGDVHLSDGTVVQSSSVDQHINALITDQTQHVGQLPIFLNQVFSGLLSSMQTLSTDKVSSFAQTVSDLFTARDLLFFAGDQDTQQVFAALDFDGNTLTPTCPSLFADSTCAVGTFFSQELSIGGNNVSQLIARTHAHTIHVGETVLIHEYVETIKNNALTVSWPFGDDQSLMRMAFENGAAVQEIMVNGLSLAPNQFSVATQDGLKVVSLPTDTPAGATTTIKLIYTTPGIPSSNSSIAFFEQKQPGTGSDPFTLTVTYPDTYTPKTVAPKATFGHNSIIFSGSLDQDRLYAVGF